MYSRGDRVYFKVNTDCVVVSILQRSEKVLFDSYSKSICYSYQVQAEGRSAVFWISEAYLFPITEVVQPESCSVESCSVESLLSDTGKLWNSFITLPEEHSMERQEFASAIHVIQGLLAMRLCRKSHPEIFPTQK